MKRFMIALGFIWLLPMTIVVWLGYILWAWTLGYIRYDGAAGFLVARFVVRLHVPNWYTRAWRDWAGWSGPCVVIVKPGYETGRTLTHELRHCWQQFLFGIFHYPLYGLALTYIWFFQKDRHAYLDNPFERDARAAAGQQVNIPRNKWRQGPDDRWPWWVLTLVVLSPLWKLISSTAPFWL